MRRSENEKPGFRSSLSPTADPENVAGGPRSSPLQALAEHDEPGMTTTTMMSPSVVATATKTRPHSRVLSGPELSPLRILQQRRQNADGNEVAADKTTGAAAASTPVRSPRKSFMPEKRFPVRVNPAAAADAETPRAKPQPRVQEIQMSLQDALRENEGLRHAIEIFGDEDVRVSRLTIDENVPLATGGGHGAPAAAAAAERDGHYNGSEDDEPAFADDTMISTFSTFSAVPNLTMFARLGASPTKEAETERMPGRSQSPNRTPRAAGPLPNRTPGGYDNNNNNTTSLLDFTEQLRFQQSAARRGGDPSSPNSTTTPRAQRNSYNDGNSNSNNSSNSTSLVNLLDFDLPPLPTPRSVPSITPRELESLKSGFLSEISSLRASLSGKEAEAQSLKAAVGDAEKRVGESLEQLREEKTLRAGLQAEREGWERRGREMEGVLRKVREEIVLGAREREELEARLDEADKRREMAEMMAQEAESKMAGLRAGKASAEAAAAAAAGGGGGVRSPSGSGSNREVEIAVERVARELHALYKGKHETKVAALKKSYEGRWEKRVRELEARAADLARENDELRVGRDATMTRVDPAREALLAQHQEREARDSAQMRGLEAEVEKLEAVVRAVKEDNGELRVLLEKERVEKGELVSLAEEMMSMQSFVGSSASGGHGRGASAGMAADGAGQGGGAGSVTGTPVATSRLTRRSSTSGRASGIKPPRAAGIPGPSAESRIGRVAHERTKSAQPGSGLGGPMRSGIMSSIERMGSYKGRGE